MRDCMLRYGLLLMSEAKARSARRDLKTVSGKDLWQAADELG